MKTVALIDNPFGGPSEVAETGQGASAAALAQREVAEVQAAMVIAKRFPRDQRQAMDRILTACARPSLAEVAVYQYGRGGQDVTGPSIRLAEELARGWGNIVSGLTELSRSNGMSECLAYCWDLESNFRDEKRFQVRHWRDTRKGGYALTDERDIYELIANQGARRKRACILAVIPGDVQEAALRQCEETMKVRAEVTPERINGMLEAFAKFGVTREHIEARIQRHLGSITPAQMVQMMRIHNSLRDGMSAPADWFEQPAGEKPTVAAVNRLDEIAGNAPQTDQNDVRELDPDPAPDPAPAQRRTAGRREAGTNALFSE